MFNIPCLCVHSELMRADGVVAVEVGRLAVKMKFSWEIKLTELTGNALLRQSCLGHRQALGVKDCKVAEGDRSLRSMH